MLARPYHPADAHCLDELLGCNRAGDVRLEHDEILVVGERGKPSGVLVFRPGAFVHELECGKDFRQRLRADALANYAIAQGRTKQYKLVTAIFQVAKDNLPMQRWVESLGAVRQAEGEIVYILEPA